MPRRSLLGCPLVAVVLPIALLGACNDDGRSLDPAPEVPVAPETTTTTSVTPDAGFTTDDTAIGLNLSSPSFAAGEALDRDFTCDGTDVSPPLVIAGTPPNAAELAVTMVDRTAGVVVHWVVAGIPATTLRLDTGVIPPGAVTASNFTGSDGWAGPCPPPGDEPHEYVFSVYATAEPIGLTPGLDGQEAITLIEDAAVASTLLVARYER